MKLELSRRDLLASAAGAAAGVALSPLPWKLLDDLSIWTQQPTTPTPRPAGPVAFRHTSCSLCPAVCGLRARCFGPVTVGFAGVAGHPASDGGLCPLGLTAHHLARHPLRVVEPERVVGGVRQGIDHGAAVAVLAAALAAAAGDRERRVAIVDGRPGRSLSRTMRGLAAATGGVYLAPTAVAATAALTARFDAPLALGVDLAAVRRVLSFGAPVLTATGTPGLLARRRGDSRYRPPSERVEVVHVGSVRSRSAALADRFVAVAPGAETAFALGLARVLLAEQLADAAFVAARTTGVAELQALVASFDPTRVEERTGVPAEVVAALARELATHGPAVVVGGDPGAPLGAEAEAAVAILNLLLGAPFGPLVARAEPPRPSDDDAVLAAVSDLAVVADGSVGLLVLDATVAEGLLPWPRVDRLLAADAVVVSLSPFRAGLGARASLLLPGPAPLEEAVELDGADDAPRATVAVAPALLAPPPGVVGADEVLRAAAAAAGLALPAPAPGRAAAIVAAGRGQVFDPDTSTLVPIADMASADALDALLARGGCWVDDAVPPPAGRFTFLRAGEAARLVAASSAAPPAAPVARVSLPWEVASAAPPSPLLSKLTRETALYAAPATERA